MALFSAVSAAAAADVLPGLPPGPPVPYPQVLSSGRAGGLTLVRSFSDEQKAALLRACSAVVYTPAGEHFGIVPLECMAAVRPVVACSSGGPLESVVHGSTGLLCEPTPQAFAAARAGCRAASPCRPRCQRRRR
jgi:glycosyltransferase involved in cell wall biosynthesis